MQELNLHNNDLYEIDDLELYMPALEEINFSKNQIPKMDNLLKIATLTSVNLAHNRISTLPETGWEEIGLQLRELDLSHNLIM